MPMDRSRYLFDVLFSIVIPFLIWHGLITLLAIPEYLLPAPYDVIFTISSNLPVLSKHTMVTTAEIFIGYIAALAVGIPLGVAMGSCSTVERILSPTLVALQSVPKSAFAPLLVLWFGFGLIPKVLLVLSIAFFPILVATLAGLKSIQPDMINLGRSMGLGPVRMFFAIRLPAALPSMFSGCRVAMTLAVVGAVVAEFVAADRGLGYLLLVSQSQFDTKMLFAALLVLAVLGIVLHGTVAAIERIAIPWHVSLIGDRGHWA